MVRTPMPPNQPLGHYPLPSSARSPAWAVQEAQLHCLHELNQERLCEASFRQDAIREAALADRTKSKEEASERLAPSAEPQSAETFAKQYTKPFCDFMTANPTVFHAVGAFKDELKAAGWTELNERDAWKIKRAGHYFVERNGSSMIAFVVGNKYEPGDGAAIIAGHVDALTAKLKPFSHLPDKSGFRQLGVTPYGGALNSTWLDRDLGVGGRVLVQEGDKVVTKVVKLDWPIARIPTLAPHFGAVANLPYNLETQMVPVIGMSGDSPAAELSDEEVNAFTRKQPAALVRTIGKELGLKNDKLQNIINWELELFDVQPAGVGGIDKEFIFAGRIDDKLCSWAAMRALLDGSLFDTNFSSIIKVVGLFDNEEIGSLLRQGARGNFLPLTLERAISSLANGAAGPDIMGQTYANSFLVSSDVTHAVNPNFLGQYLPEYSPLLNVGVTISADSGVGHMTTDSVSTAIFRKCAARTGAQVQTFHIRNDSRSGGTVGPMLSAATGIRAIDVGIPQLSMHSIRATTGSLDPGYGVLGFMGFLNGFESVDKEFRS